MKIQFTPPPYGFGNQVVINTLFEDKVKTALLILEGKKEQYAI